MRERISNWSNFPIVEAEMKSFTSTSDLVEEVKSAESFIARGMGRCYGDASLEDHIISTLKYDNILDFDSTKGIIEAQAGVTLDDLISFLVPKGWFLPVAPGTKYITLGGAVASDIHGKNHHVDGSFKNHILSMQLLLASGETTACTKESNPDLFMATCGGMGLTGIILSVRISLKKIANGFITQTSVKAKNLDEVFSLFETYKDAMYSVAWIDCLQSGDNIGRSLLMVGEHAKPEEIVTKENKPQKEHPPWLGIPFAFPDMVMNRFSVKAFNFLFYHKQFRKIQKSLVTFDKFFFPLDFIKNWNRMYGKRGFIQYQFVLPLDKSKEGLEKILLEINRQGMGSFLAVLKLFGEGDGLISFPLRGYTLALDFPMRKGLFEFLDHLDELVLAHGGRIYLTKDARMKRDVFWKSYPGAEKFKKIILDVNPSLKWKSKQAERLLL